MPLTQQQVIQEVRDRLRATHLPLTFDVLDAAVRQDDEWWYVPVSAATRDGSPAPREALVNAYANIENDIEDQTATHVLFVPVKL